MTDSIRQFVGVFNAVVEECEAFLFITRDSDLQRDACAKLDGLLLEIANYKQSAIAVDDENSANLLLGCECVAKFLTSEIRMWLFLKAEQPDKAWDMLVDAQRYVLDAIRSDEGFAHLDKYLDRLNAIEHLVFPPQVFLSSGMIVEAQICSICEQDYEKCGHIKGRPYMGSFCVVRLVPSALDHVAIVENPANKRCRVLKFSVEGGNRNRMTWRVEPIAAGNDKPQEFVARSVIDTFGGDQDSLHPEVKIP